MIVVCPSCATRYDLPATAGPAGSIVRCRACNHSWLEGAAVEVVDAEPVVQLGFAHVGIHQQHPLAHFREGFGQQGIDQRFALGG